MQYVPLWTCILKSRKVASLPPDRFRFWVLCLLSAQEHDHRRGTLPSLDDLAYSLHMDTDQVAVFMAELVKHGFVTDCDGVYAIHDWKEWKNVPDPTAAERKRKQRDRMAQSASTVHVAEITAVTDVTDVTDAIDISDVTDVTDIHDVTGYQNKAEQNRAETPLPPGGDGRLEVRSAFIGSDQKRGA